MGELQVYKQRNNKYEQERKNHIIRLCQSDKPYQDILAYIKSEIETSTKMTDFNYTILCFKNDGVWALNRAIEKIYGVSHAKEDDKPSGGKENIQTVDIMLADGTRIKAPFGKISLPELGREAVINIGYNNNNQTLFVQGSCQFKFSSLIDEIITYTQDLLNTESVYRNQAIELRSNFEPIIMNLSNIEKEFMVLTDKTTEELIPLMTRVKNPQKCKDRGIPIKTGILFEGPYGTGKTLAAFKIAKEAIANNYVFIYLKDPTLLARVLQLSKTLDKNGNGVIVFLEDVDQVTKGDRDSAMQDILNTLDGGDTKNMNVIALFTTNHIEKINPTFLRGKRIGSIVSFSSLDAATAKAFLEHTFNPIDYTLVKKGLDEVCKNIEKANIVPAFMAEICEKVKSNLIYNDTNEVSPKSIQNSLDSYMRQVKLSQQADTGKSKEKQFVDSLAEILRVEESFQKMEEIRDIVS